MKKKKIWITLLTLVLMLALGQSALGFGDTSGDPNETAIQTLKQRGVVSGDLSGDFRPQDALTHAEAAALLVKAFELDLSNINFVKEPLASDSYPNARDDAWYSTALVIAAEQGLELPAELQPGAGITREAFAHALFKAISTTGDYAYIEIFMMYADQEEVSQPYGDSIQKLLVTSVVELDEQQMFHPQATISRGEAAAWLNRALAFVDEMRAVEGGITGEPGDGDFPVSDFPLYEVQLTTSEVSEGINKVTVTAQAPHPGYGIRIHSIVFEEEQAVVYVEAILPDPDMIYPQVITEVSAEAYVAAEIAVVLDPSLQNSVAAQ